MSGREEFQDIAYQIARLVTEKNKQYGDSFGRVTEIMRVLYPACIALGQYSDALFMVRVLDKLCRISTGKADPGRSRQGHRWLLSQEDRRKAVEGQAPARPTHAVDTAIQARVVRP